MPYSYVAADRIMRKQPGWGDASKPRRRLALRLPRWPLVLLLTSCGLAALVLIDALRSLRSQEHVADGALRDYASFATWSYSQHLREALTSAAKEALGAVNHGSALHTNSVVPGPGEVSENLPWVEGCLCRQPRFGPVPTAFFGFSVQADTVGIAENQSPRPASEWQYEDGAPSHNDLAPFSRSDRGWLLDTLRRQIRSGYRSEWGFTYVMVQGAHRAHYLAYTLMPTAWGDTIAYGAEYSRAAVESFLGDVLDAAGLLPPTFTQHHRNRQLLTAEVLDGAGASLIVSDNPPSWHLDARATLPQSYGGLRIRAAIRPELASQLVIGGLPRSRLPFLVTFAVLAIGLSVVAIGQLRREGELGRLRADFVATVSHELRTPLAQIRLDLDTIRLGRHPTEAHRSAAFDRVDRETRRLTYLIENVLRFSRRGRGQSMSVSKALDLGAEVARIADEFRPLAAARRATLNVHVHGTPRARMDPEGLRQVLLNLLDNAVKYGPPRQTVDVRVTYSGARPCITVADQGPGVPAAERETIWEPFRRGASALRQGVGGSGIGLTLVREIIEQHGGLVGVATEVGGGAAFFVEFPAMDAAEARLDVESVPVGIA
jgi:signal transduction histidine kinase